MKKILALVLALIMVLSAAATLAESEKTPSMQMKDLEKAVTEAAAKAEEAAKKAKEAAAKEAEAEAKAAEAEAAKKAAEEAKTAADATADAAAKAKAAADEAQKIADNLKAEADKAPTDKAKADAAAKAAEEAKKAADAAAKAEEAAKKAAEDAAKAAEVAAKAEEDAKKAAEAARRAAAAAAAAQAAAEAAISVVKVTDDEGANEKVNKLTEGGMEQALAQIPEGLLPEGFTKVNEISAWKIVGDVENATESVVVNFEFASPYEADSEVYLAINSAAGDWLAVKGAGTAESGVNVTLDVDTMKKLGNDPFVVMVVSK